MCPFGFEDNEAKSRQTYTPAKVNSHKILVKVRADHDTDGTIRPVSFQLPDEPKVVIDKILGMRQAASLKAGGQGQRYEISITCGDVSREMYLFDDEGVWFIGKD